MKIAAFALLASAATASTLRGNSAATVDETQVIMHGINKELTSHDVELLEASMSAAYMKVFKNSAPTTFAMDLAAGIESVKQ